MGRPKGSVNNPEREETQGEGQDMPERVEPKVCPNCGAVAVVGKDNQGMFRAYCSECGYWDSVAYVSKEDAIAGWNSAGGIPKADY